MAHETDRELFLNGGNFQDEIYSQSHQSMREHEYTIKLRLAAHLAIVMLLNGRILHDERSIMNFNQILKKLQKLLMNLYFITKKYTKTNFF